MFTGMLQREFQTSDVCSVQLCFLAFPLHCNFESESPKHSCTEVSSLVWKTPTLLFLKTFPLRASGEGTREGGDCTHPCKCLCHQQWQWRACSRRESRMTIPDYSLGPQAPPPNQVEAPQRFQGISPWNQAPPLIYFWHALRILYIYKLTGLCTPLFSTVTTLWILKTFSWTRGIAHAGVWYGLHSWAQWDACLKMYLYMGKAFFLQYFLCPYSALCFLFLLHLWQILSIYYNCNVFFWQLFTGKCLALCWTYCLLLKQQHFAFLQGKENCQLSVKLMPDWIRCCNS